MDNRLDFGAPLQKVAHNGDLLVCLVARGWDVRHVAHVAGRARVFIITLDLVIVREAEATPTVSVSPLTSLKGPAQEAGDRKEGHVCMYPQLSASPLCWACSRGYGAGHANGRDSRRQMGSHGR